MFVVAKEAHRSKAKKKFIEHIEIDILLLGLLPTNYPKSFYYE